MFIKIDNGKHIKLRIEIIICFGYYLKFYSQSLDWTGHNVYFELEGNFTDSTVNNTGEAGDMYTMKTMNVFKEYFYENKIKLFWNMLTFYSFYLQMFQVGL